MPDITRADRKDAVVILLQPEDQDEKFLFRTLAAQLRQQEDNLAGNLNQVTGEVLEGGALRLTLRHE